MSAHAGPPSPEVAHQNAAWKAARAGRSGPITRADRRRAAKIARVWMVKDKAGRKHAVNTDRRRTRAFCQAFGVGGKRYRALMRRTRSAS